MGFGGHSPWKIDAPSEFERVTGSKDSCFRAGQLEDWEVSYLVWLKRGAADTLTPQAAH
jgi:hypothetical protein